jgi:hypothetical protein
MFDYSNLNNSASSNWSVCSGCLCATVCKWRDAAMQAEAEIKKKTMVDRDATINDVYKILDIKVACKYKQNQPVTRLYNGDLENIITPCKATDSDQTHTNTISTPKSGEYTGSTIKKYNNVDC